jgi:hypothetical protein
VYTESVRALWLGSGGEIMGRVRGEPRRAGIQYELLQKRMVSTHFAVRPNTHQVMSTWGYDTRQGRREVAGPVKTIELSSSFGGKIIFVTR